MPTKELFLSFNVFFQTFFCPQILCSTLIPAFYGNCFPKSDHTLRLPKCHASPSSSVSLLLDRFMVCCAPGSFGHRERLSSAPSPVPRSSLVSRCPLSPNHVLPLPRRSPSACSVASRFSTAGLAHPRASSGAPARVVSRSVQPSVLVFPEQNCFHARHAPVPLVLSLGRS